MTEPDHPGPIHYRADEGDRGIHMAVRLRRTAVRQGVRSEALGLLERAHALAMEPRRAHLSDQRHPDFLHPGRTVLILLLDGHVTDGTVLAGATLIDSMRPDLRVPDHRTRIELGETLGDFVDSVPCPPAPDLTEKLVIAPEGVRMAALAECLDHLRHAHLWPDPEVRRSVHAQAVTVYGPLARRTNERLARRYEWWIRMFANRHLGTAITGP